jgi:hypothetical protein
MVEDVQEGRDTTAVLVVLKDGLGVVVWERGGRAIEAKERDLYVKPWRAVGVVAERHADDIARRKPERGVSARPKGLTVGGTIATEGDGLRQQRLKDPHEGGETPRAGLGEQPLDLRGEL